MKYVYAYSGFVTVEADSEEEAYKKVDDLVAVTAWQSDNCEEICVDNIELVDEYDYEEDEEEEEEC